MDKKITDLFYLVRCSLWEEAPKLSELESETDGEKNELQKEKYWDELYGLAVKMKLNTFVQYALKLGNGLSCPKEKYMALVQEMRKTAVGRVLAAGELAGMQEELRERGIETAVVKGQALAAAYPHPELRAGCDIDLYVDEAKERAVYEWAKQKGYQQERRVPGTHHGKITHPVLGLIELHVSLCNADEALVESAKDKEVLLLHPTEPFCALDNCGSKVMTIGMTDHMLFIINHMINHYLHGEAQARMLVDVNLFFARYQKEMDLVRLEQTLERLRYQRFFRAVLEIGNRYLGFTHAPEWTEGVLEEEAEELLLDFCRGEFNKESALKVYDEYCKRTMPGGVKAVAFKLQILGTNVRTAFQLRHQMSVKSMAAIGWQRMKNMFSVSKAQGMEGDCAKEAGRRLKLMERLNLMD